MKDVFSIDSLDGIIFVDFFKSPSTEDFFSAIDKVALCDQNNRLRAWNLTCGIKLTSDQVRSIARYAKSKFTTPLSKVAIIAPDKLTFGLFRIHDVEREDSLVEQTVFRTKGEALAWLKKRTL